MNIEILYEDNHIIAVYKPAGMLVQGDATGDASLFDEVKQYLKKQYNKPGNVFLGLVHRLDRPVSGIVLFAKTSKGASRLSEEFRSHTVKKIYFAVVEGNVKEKQKTLKHYLIKDTDKNVVRVFDSQQPDALYCELRYEVIESNKHYSLLRIELKTGRPHQIRAQLSATGHPIAGDVKYHASKPLTHKSLALHAGEISFHKATGDELIHLSAPMPEIWKDLFF